MDVNAIRKDFPILHDESYIYFDNAATSQRPTCVMEAINAFYKETNANPLRGLYEWSIGATERYEAARQTVAKFIGANDSREIVFTRNATESINLVAYTYGMEFVGEGDEIALTIMEHHSNILPWQMVAKNKGAKLVYLYPDDNGELPKEELAKIGSKTKIVAMTMVSNVLGTLNPVKEAAKLVHANGGVILVDGAQSTPHMKVDVRDIDADFYAFSGHKMLGPMGIGALYGKLDLLEKMPPFLRGGEMIEYVTLEDATYAEVPTKFEAGTVNAAGAVGLAAAINYLENIGMDEIGKRENELTKLAMEAMAEIPHITIYGSSDPSKHHGIITFNIDGCHPHDVSSVLDSEKVCIRAGHHCAQPLMKHLNVGSTARASLYFYNTEEEVERFAKELGKVRSWLGYKD